MLGLVNKALQKFVRDTYGCAMWRKVALQAQSPTLRFEAMLFYEDALTQRLIVAACAVLDKPRDAFLEDLGTYLVSDPKRGSMRRLLRFGGERFEDFLHSLDDLADLVGLALRDLSLPPVRFASGTDGCDTLHVGAGIPGYCGVLLVTCH